MSQGRVGIRTRLPDIVVLELNGQLDQPAIELLDRTLTNLVRQGRVKVAVNCAGLTHVTADSMGIFLSHLIKVRKAGGDIKFCEMRREVGRVVRLLNLGTLLTIVDSEEDAVGAFRKQTEEPSRSRSGRQKGPEQLSIEVVRSDRGVAILRLAGYIDRHTQRKLDKGLRKLFDQGSRTLVVNCAGLDYISSTGIGSFINYRKMALERGGTVCFCSMNDSVRTLFSMLGLTNLFIIHPTEAEALAAADQ